MRPDYLSPKRYHLYVCTGRSRALITDYQPPTTFFQSGIVSMYALTGVAPRLPTTDYEIFIPTYFHIK